MKLLLLWLLPLLNSFPAAGPAPVRVTFNPLTKAVYLQARKGLTVTKPRLTRPLKKQEGRLVIPTTAGPKVLTDVVIDAAAVEKGHSEEEAIQYTYLGYLPDFSCHLIRVQYYETTKWLLISNSGRQLSLWGEPIFSPDQQRIFAICQGLEYSGGQPNSLQLLQLQNGVLREVWTMKPKTWQPYRAYWASPNSLLLVKEMWAGKASGGTYTYAKLMMQ